jgi:hypothetical protein
MLGHSVRLLPYLKGKAPGNTELAKQEDLDNVLRAYSTGIRTRVSKATLIEVGEWRTGTDADDATQGRLFNVRAILGFSALSHRRLFAGHMGYCCYDTYSMVLQKYQTSRASRFQYTTRRRDGGASHYWDADGLAFHRPLHVASHAQFEIDRELATCLLDFPSGAQEPLMASLEEFNAANTDAGEVPPHIEVVLIKSAFERLLNIGSKDKDFARALQDCIPNMQADPKGPLLENWKTRFPKAPSILWAWAQEFSALRGANAHGIDRKLNHFVWGTHAHLAFASVLFPLIVKKKLADAQLWAQQETDAGKLRRIQDYLMHDPFNLGRTKREVSHPWNDIENEVRMACASRRFQEKLRRGIFKEP